MKKANRNGIIIKFIHSKQLQGRIQGQIQNSTGEPDQYTFRL